MKITFVKKILADGSPCKKCGEVADKLEKMGHMARIDETIIADERDSNSPGMLIAAKYNVERAPFFVIDKGEETPVIYTVFMKFLKEVLEQQTSEAEELKEIMKDNDLDFL
ncbi:MAG: hypothetical protein COA42_20510 [Alteromonadaceae bacterium]|nr:MAG: hypothetical protein COA42_20510 [Alteromonadaceae bacterium]